MNIQFLLNGVQTHIEAPADRRVVELLREDLGLTGTKMSCASGECGACTILVDGRMRLSCLMTAAQLEGRDITTIEGVGEPEALHPLQRAFVEKGAVQCGFCTPGMILASRELLQRCPRPSREEIRRGIAGHLCRCTGYHKIVDAVQAAARVIAEEKL